ncbi:GxxExxY protein [Desulfonema magnum]|uniref:GxxExxY domain-containing protein n=1 Tax=Desulfonema magnum TaxID=45655 RepID=A0A975GSU6_9BACT|nr:GxxExxY protein [Desulfonema magnum]QTA91453.1 GxxExxY domain-containing protein [Desulfonema magnum]
MYEDLTYTIIGCCFKVHNALKNIWHEEIYEKALQKALRSEGLKAERQQEFDVFYFDKNVGRYRVDLLVGDKIIIELKVAPKILPLHQAQLISYLKGFDKPLGILANFGGKSVEHRTFPNKLHLKTPLEDRFDFDKLQMSGKEEIEDLFIMANRILITLGAGYFHQIYRRAFYYELEQAGIRFDTAKELPAIYQNETLGSKEVNFFIIGDMLLSVVAVRKMNDVIFSRFRSHISYLGLRRGLIFNFNSLHLDFMYFRTE